MSSSDPLAAFDFALSGDSAPAPHLRRRLDLAVVLPTYNERENLPVLLARLERSLRGLAWEAIIVDDDSPDGTAEVVCEYAQRDSRVRLIHRVGRRGLASACIEGMLATSAKFIAIMDADLQHDDAVLPEMLARMRREPLDVVVGRVMRRAEAWASSAGAASG